MVFPSQPTWRRRTDLACLLLSSAALAVQFRRLHAVIAPSAAPDMAFIRDPNAKHTVAMHWLAWWDQGQYHRAAVAWANCVTDSVFHWYLLGYSLLGAGFVRITPADPFMLPNLAALVGTLWLFCAVASRLLADVPFRIPVACGVFIATTLLPVRVLTSWVVPWTTTPETLCIFAALLGAIRLVEGGKHRDAFLTGLATAAIAGFRPADAAVVGLAICLVVGPAVLARRGRIVGNVAAATAGALIPLVVFGGAYLMTWGATPSAYMELSARIGFEPRLLALRWVTLMIDPRPLYPDGRGIAEVFFWIVPGFAGMAATLVLVRNAVALPHRLVIAALCGDLMMFVIYRDLHPIGLWTFGNYHYFKWTFPVFGLYALRLVWVAVRRDRRRPVALAASVFVVLLLFCWRAGVSGPDPAGVAVNGGAVTVGGGLAPMNAIVLVPGHGLSASPVVEGSAVTASGIVLHPGTDYVTYNSTSVLRIAPLRPLPPEATTFRFAEGTVLDDGREAALARQSITWGLPYLWGGKARAQAGGPSR